MAITKITGAGLGSIAILVAMLWGCIVGERLIVQRANRELAGAMSEIRQLQKRRVVPASKPVTHHPARPAIG